MPQSPRVSTNYSYTNIDDPLGPGSTVAQGINNQGQIVGHYLDSTNRVHGFLYNGSQYTTVDDPSAFNTDPFSINDAGQIVGDHVGGNSFLYSGGTYVTIADPAGFSTQALEINNAGQIVGSYMTGDGTRHGFLYSGGSYTTIDEPLATKGPLAGTYLWSINNTGQIVGQYGDASGTHGFLLNLNTGSFTTLDDPFATQGTQATSINDNGDIVGVYFDPSGFHGFLYSGGTYTTLNGPSASYTVAYGINNAGQIVGAYASGGTGHGFVASPMAPTISIGIIAGDDVLDAAESQRTLTIAGTSTGVVGRTVTISLNGAQYFGTVASDGTWSATVPESALRSSVLSDGTYAVTADVTDLFGNPAQEASRSLTVQRIYVPSPDATALTIDALGDFNASGNTEFVWRNGSAVMSTAEYDATAQTVTKMSLGGVPSWAVLGSGHFSDANGSSSTNSQMLMDYVPNGTMTLWWIGAGAVTGIDLGQRWINVGFIGAGQFVTTPGVLTNFLVTNLTDHHLYDWWITPQNQLGGVDLTATSGASWSNVGLVAAGQFTANGGTNFLVNNTVDNHLYDWWINSNNTLGGIDLGPYWSNVTLVGTGQFTTNGGTNFLVTNTADHHLYDWWISGSTLGGIDLTATSGISWSNVQLVTVGQFDNRSATTELLVQNTVDHHLYEWWITSQGQLDGIDLGPYWANVQLIGSGHYNGNSANDELLVHNTVDGHYYEWWIANNQLQGVDLGPSMSASGSSSSSMTIDGGGTAAASLAPASTSRLVQAMASFGSTGSLVNSSGLPSGTDPSQQQSALAAPIDQHLAH
jgi:probable HAF family extracellular repeat protein